MMRLDKYLSDMGLGTRSELKGAIKKGEASVDGNVIKDPGYHVPAGAKVCFRGEDVSYTEHVYYMMNKPAGVITATEDASQKTVLDLIAEPKRKDLFPVGRLDKDTEGLLLITNDGALAHRLLAPGKHVDKVYFARVSGIVTEAEVRQFAAGLEVDESFTAMPAKLKILSATDGISEVELTIQEGKYHQVKRMFQAVGMEVIYLKRLSMGALSLDPKLAPGEYRLLTEKEMEF